MAVNKDTGSYSCKITGCLIEVFRISLIYSAQFGVSTQCEVCHNMVFKTSHFPVIQNICFFYSEYTY